MVETLEEYPEQWDHKAEKLIEEDLSEVTADNYKTEANMKRLVKV